MADKEIIRTPFQPEFANITQAGFRFLQQVAEKINNATARIVTIETPPTYADNAAAVTGGLAVGSFYKTATGEVRIVVS